MRTDIRPAEAADLNFMWRALALAAHEPSVETARAVPEVARFLEDWRRPEDFGFLAVNGDGTRLGAAWARQFRADECPLVFHDSQTPELNVAVVADARDRGLGQRLLERLIAEAETRGAGLCLSIRETNPAVRLYERLGFRHMPGSDFINRWGGTSFGMLHNRH